LQKLKEKLINYNIYKFSDLKKEKKLLDEVNEFIKETKLSTLNMNIFFKLLNEDVLYCVCGKSIRTYDANKKKFRTHCKFCCSELKDLKTVIKKSRDIEAFYNGDFYNKQETLELLKNINYENYLGSGSQRTFIKEEPKLYFSILENTKNLNSVKKINIRGRITFLLENITDLCCKCGLDSQFCNVTHKFLKYCKKCVPRYPTKEFFKLKYPNNWQTELSKDKEMRKNITKGQFTLDWFLIKYGDDGTKKYEEHWKKIFDSMQKTSYSKISQDLFWKLYNELNDDNNIYFAELNREKHINLNKQDKEIYGDIKKVRINLDFFYNNKIIEFNGDYWRSSQKSRETDFRRKLICESKGYDVLFVWESEYKKNPELVLNKCIRFLTSDTNIKYNDRYLIETKNGYEDFDNIISRGVKQTLKIKTENSEIVVTHNHLFVVLNNEVIASELKIGDYLETKNGLEHITDIDNCCEMDVFDVLNTESHTYLANNINNHNCEFTGSSHTLVDAGALEKFLVREPQEIRDGKLKIYKHPEKGHQYICSVDAAKDGIDDFSVQIIDITDFKFEQVASAQLQIDYLLMPEYINDWCEYYNHPYLIIENNEGAGQSVADQMYQTYEYENLHFDTDGVSKKKKKYPGFRTTTRTRKLILQTLKLFIENNNLLIHDKKTINQFYTFILLNNKYQADENCKDDAIMSLAIAFAPFCNSKNFEDMKELVKRLYNEFDETSTEDKGFIEYLTVGSFDDGVDMNEQAQETNYNNFSYIQEPDGFY
jgi:very-short-patch-repair endonuclease